MAVNRREVRPFRPDELELMRGFADQAVIAIENARLLSELRDSLSRQTATAEVLRVISASPGQLAPVFESLLANSLRICAAGFGVLMFRDGDGFDAAATQGLSSHFLDALRDTTRRPGPLTALGQMSAEKRTVHFADLAATEAYRQRDPLMIASVEDGNRALVAVPMLREDELLGAIVIYRREARAFSDKEIELVENFAAQAVIAIENARLLTELRESLDRQTATSDILRAIAEAPGEAEPTLRKICETTAQLFSAAGVSIRIAEGDVYSLTIGVGRGAEEVTSILHGHEGARQPIVARTLPGTVIRENRQIQLPDLDNLDPALADWPGPPIARAAGIRTMVGVPLRRESEAIGAMMVYRDQLRAFDAGELRLLQSFADQAVIAIENARLLSELRESLDRQTATADILRVIASTPGDPTRALDTIAETAVRMFDASSVGFRRREGDALHYICAAGPSATAVREAMPVAQIDKSLFMGPCVVENRQLQVEDMTQYGPAGLIGKMTHELGIRTSAFTPLSREGEAIGVMVVNRTEQRPFRADELEVMKGFADQAVIAIENARLLTELRESLDRQTATADILSVIASTPGDPTRALDTIAETAARMFDASSAIIRRVDGTRLHAVCAAGPAASIMRDAMPDTVIDAADESGIAVLEARQVHVHDRRLVRRENSAINAVVSRLPIHTQAFTPLLREGTAIGVMIVNRSEVRPYQPNELDLMKGFADQAVIAIENARLLSELRESLDRQTATAEILRAIASTPGDPKRALDTIAEMAIRMFDAANVTIRRHEGDVLRLMAAAGPIGAVQRDQLHDLPMDRTGFAGQCFLDNRQIHIEDLATAVAIDSPAMHLSRAMGAASASAAFTPLTQRGKAIGMMNVRRNEVRPFRPDELELMRGFADQAVIAIENARLLTELREALDYQTATSDVLKVISRSTVELDAVLQTVVTSAVRLCRADTAVIFRNEGGEYRWASGHALTPEYDRVERHVIIRPGMGTLVGRAALHGRTVQIADAWTDPDYEDKDHAREGNARAMLGVPLLRENTVIGVIGLARSTVEPFSEREVQLVATFADQAVIAIENARLFGELRAAHRRSRAVGRRADGAGRGHRRR